MVNHQNSAWHMGNTIKVLGSAWARFSFPVMPLVGTHLFLYGPLFSLLYTL